MSTPTPAQVDINTILIHKKEKSVVMTKDVPYDPQEQLPSVSQQRTAQAQIRRHWLDLDKLRHRRNLSLWRTSISKETPQDLACWIPWDAVDEHNICRALEVGKFCCGKPLHVLCSHETTESLANLLIF